MTNYIKLDKESIRKYQKIIESLIKNKIRFCIETKRTKYSFFEDIVFKNGSPIGYHSSNPNKNHLIQRMDLLALPNSSLEHDKFVRKIIKFKTITEESKAELEKKYFYVI